jgi:FMN phosphatase YigB (HAD superfamily)
MQKHITLYIFDLDNTLIDEKFYIYSKFKLLLEKEFIDNSLKQEILFYFNQNFPKRRKNIIQIINQKFNIKIDINLYKYYLREIICDSSLKIINNSVEKLEELMSEGKEIWICTNGNPLQQSNKITQLQKSCSFKLQVMYCDNFRPKPSPNPINRILRISQKPRVKTLFVGDAWTDRLSANLAGVKFKKASSFFIR